MIKLLVNGVDVKFETTKFPDGTSQVWKLEDFEFDQYADEPVILWLFENEAELFHVLQLNALVEAHVGEPCILRVPYLPYGRQDKEIQNNLTFALQTFKDVLYNAGICRIETFDAHSKHPDLIYSTSPAEFHRTLTNYDVICFPDLGASERYKYSFDIDIHSHIAFEKVRNQQTGEITGLKLLGTSELNGRSILIVDDICDGGMTFIKVAEALKQYNPSKIDLAVSHGLFTKGRQVLHDAGIGTIHTTNSLLRNPEGFKVW